MAIKRFFLLIFILLFLNGCSSLNASLDSPSINIWGNRDYISDTEVDNSTSEQSEAQTELDPVIVSTQLALQSNPAQAPLQTNVQEQMDEFLAGNDKEPEFDNIWDRLPRLFQFSDIDNKRIQAQKKLFIKHKRNIEKISKRASPFLYLITDEVDKRGMPGEIALLPFIESAFKTKAYSRKKASGLWQFVPATGRHFGLKQTWWYDGRRDIHTSTHAALTYLKQLNKYYKGDWMLALAAYNAGAGNVNKAVRKNRKKGKPIDYWSLDLPRETRKYVPKLLALAKVIHNYKDYGISLSPVENTPQLILVGIQSQLDLSKAAKMADISLKEVKSYNPGFKQWATDPEGPHHLLLPIEKVEQFEKQLALLDDSDHVQWQRHKIRSGESLSVIAHKYKISVSVLKTANHLKSDRIRAGKHLMVPVGSTHNISRTNIASVKNAPSKSKTLNSSGDKLTYTVNKGDSFWVIARRFDMPHRKLISINGLSSSDTLSIGQVLIIGQKPDIPGKTSSNNTREINYKVKRGDSLYVISKRFNVTINELVSWNGLNRKKYLKTGQKLKVYVAVNSQTI